MKNILVSVVTVLLLTNIYAATKVLRDSVRLEDRNGKKFIIHLVDTRETLYGISRRYGVSIDDISNENPLVLEGLKVGQELVIPWTPLKVTPTTRNVQHFVDIGETLYSIARLYAVTVDEIKDWNQLSSNDLKVGQELIIQALASLPSSNTGDEFITESTPQTSPGDTYHEVARQETLYGISQQYGVTVDDLKRWNNLVDNSISVGQQLLIESGQSLISQEDVKVERPALSVTGENGRSTSDIDPNTTSSETSVNTPGTDSATAVKEPNVPTIEASTITQFNSRVVREGSLEKIYEEGLAMVIENSTDTRKYLALHRTASVGTVMRVKNMMNNIAIYVRVVGKLPDTGSNEKLVLKVSRTAFERLGALDQQFPVEISYIP